VIDSASDIGGTWAEERLYPNLLSQNSYGLYEFSDLPLSDVVPKEHGDDPRNQFIAGWKINRYLRAWVEKWRLEKHIRLNWKVRGLIYLKINISKVFLRLKASAAWRAKNGISTSILLGPHAGI
jgi:cation diffusion facilitator CzcD-associated flavoprotein CzcO